MPNSPKSLLEFLLREIVDAPDKVVISEETDQYGGTLLKTTVAGEDMGKVIGKGGKTIRSIRNLVKAISIKQSIHTNIALTEEYSSSYQE